MTKITPVLFQTNKTRPEAYIVDMILSKLGKDWKYEFYTDADIITFYKKIHWMIYQILSINSILFQLVHINLIYSDIIIYS